MKKCKAFRRGIGIILLAIVLTGCGDKEEVRVFDGRVSNRKDQQITEESIETTYESKSEATTESVTEKPTLDSRLTFDLEQDIKKGLLYSSEDGKICDKNGIPIPAYDYLTVLENGAITDGEVIGEGITSGRGGKLVITYPEPVDEDDGKNVFSFADLKNLEFSLASGAGGWETTLVIHADGSFSGNYYDKELGVSGDDYPNGTVYCCDFTGQFTKPLKESSFFYTTKVSKINCLQKTGTEEIEDGIRYVYTNPYGLEKEDQVRIYMPEAPTILLPESFDNWMGEYALSNYPEGLPFYALNNITLQVGFVSYDLVENLREQIDAVETEALAIEDSLAEGLPTQIDYNEKTGELYQVWDDALNTVWKTLKKVKTETEMKPITAEERKWINYKEQEIDKAGKEYEGGMAQMMIMHEKGAELTKARVYELLELFD